MSRLTDTENLDTQDDFEEAFNIRNLPARSGHGKLRTVHPPKPAPAAAEANASPGMQEETFNFSYHASRHERMWILDALSGFYDDQLDDDGDGQWLDDVVALIKGGKEAHVYCCTAHVSALKLLNPGDKYLAAKIYRPRKFRNLKNDYLYREGRQDVDVAGRMVTDDGMHHAMAKKTEYGRSLLHTSWIGHEYGALQTLYAAGADVPRPLTSGNNAILMSYLGDESPAPTLNSVHLSRREARPLFERVVHNIDLMLAHNIIHADLSAYNILYWNGNLTLIDFPQAIHPHQNRSAYPIFERDVVRVCEYFARQGVKSDPKKLASSLWGAHLRHKIPDVHPLMLDPDDELSRKFWSEWSASE